MSPYRVAFFNWDLPERIGEFEFVRPLGAPSRVGSPGRIDRFFRGGLRRLAEHPWPLSASYIDELWRRQEPNYMTLLERFRRWCAGCDVLVMGNFNPIHPEVIARLDVPMKVLGFVDDPHSSYSRGLPFLWAFDAAFYVSPSYSRTREFGQTLRMWGCNKSYWLPWVTEDYPRPTDSSRSFFVDRDVSITYVGKAYGPKIDRLARFKRALGDDLQVFGRWPMRGWWGVLRGLVKGEPWWQRVKSLTREERTQLYYRSKIGLNLHLSQNVETGNMRMYEVPAHGMALVSDRAGMDSQRLIYEDPREARFYSGVDEGVAIIRSLLSNDEERIRMAQRGFERFWSDYEYRANLMRFLRWCVSESDSDMGVVS